MNCTLCIALWIAAATAGAEAGGEPSYLRAQPEVVQAWQEMRFGMFVCWGPVSLTGQEIGWSRGAPRGHGWLLRPGQGPTPGEVYDNLYKQWKPDRFDAREWVRIARDAGMKYMIFLVKHHDGFSLYDSQLTAYKSTGPEAAWKHDVMRDVADACHAAGLKLIVYYSQPDWYHPDYGTEHHDRYLRFLHGQLRELLTNYGRIDGLWFDLRGKPEDWDSENLFRMMRSLQPWLIINDRCGLPGDYDTPEQRLGRFRVDRPWETCMTLGTQWSWKPDDTIKPLKQCIDTLVTCVVRDGNLALNTNPMPDGRIEPRQAERFREVGAWLKQYGASVYGTRGGPYQSGPWGGTCYRGQTLYVHVLKWPAEGLQLPPLGRKVLASELLTGGTAQVVQSGAGLSIAVPPADRQELDTIVALTLDRPAAELGVIRTQPVSLTAGKKARASNFFEKLDRFGPDKALDDDPSTRWGCDRGTKSAWLEVDLGSPQTFGRVQISEPYGRVRRFALETRQGDTWQAFYTGTTIGEEFQGRFDPVTAQHVRLNLLETTDGPSIWEFQLFKP